VVLVETTPREKQQPLCISGKKKKDKKKKKKRRNIPTLENRIKGEI
jgi:hypothetical protein